jgi:hypothetical protein
MAQAKGEIELVISQLVAEVADNTEQAAGLVHCARTNSEGLTKLNPMDSAQLSPVINRRSSPDQFPPHVPNTSAKDDHTRE